MSELLKVYEFKEYIKEITFKRYFCVCAKMVKRRIVNKIKHQSELKREIERERVRERKERGGEGQKIREFSQILQISSPRESP